MVRLKYHKNGSILVTSLFTIGPSFIVQGRIDKKTLHFSIYDFDKNILKEGQAASIRDAKDKVKKLLVDIGVRFDGEIRKRK